jgi:hypothetical protein
MQAVVWLKGIENDLEARDPVNEPGANMSPAFYFVNTVEVSL